MAGIVYMKSNSKKSLTGSEYTGLSIPTGAKTLYVQTGNNSSDRVKYGLTTDVSASQYSPAINVSGRTMYIARKETVTSNVEQTFTLSASHAARTYSSSDYRYSTLRTSNSRTTNTTILRNNISTSLTWMNRNNVATLASNGVTSSGQFVSDLFDNKITASGYNSYTLDVTGYTIPYTFMDAHSSIYSSYKSSSMYVNPYYVFTVSGSVKNTYSVETDYGANVTVKSESIFTTNNIYTGA